MMGLMYRSGKPIRQQLKRAKTPPPSNRTFFPIIMLLLTLATVFIGFRLFGGDNAPQMVKIADPVAAAAPTVEALAQPAPTHDSNMPLVGIVSGHRGYDPGAVCDDGLTEADVNHAIALEVVDLLGRRGVQADLLDEYDPRLTDYQAEALVSVHSDSCNIPGATGFKVARVTDSAIPEFEDRLVACLNQEYGIHTGLSQHTASITDGMTGYHAFSEINPFTPGAIIETGFMLDDRILLQHRPKLVARGIAAGIICFLEQNQ